MQQCPACRKLAALRLQEIPIGAFLIVRHGDHDALDELFIVWWTDLYTAVKPRTKQPAIIHDRVEAPAALKRADSPRAGIAAGYELKRDRAPDSLSMRAALCGAHACLIVVW